MPIQRMKSLFLSAVLAVPGGCALASPMVDVTLQNWEVDRLDTAMHALDAAPPPATAAGNPVSTGPAPAETAGAQAGGLRHMLAEFAMTLRNIRYRNGGKAPETGFDCSGFVRYVYRHVAGRELPANSASQYLVGTSVARADMKVGDLVFFRIKGKRVSHVGIYLGDGRFIHAPSSGKTVSVSALSEAYWAKRFVGAKRPNSLS